MNIVLDVNVLIAALIRDSTVRRLIIEKDHEWHFPEQALEKVEKYKQLILEKSGLNNNELAELLATLLKYLTLVKKETIARQWDEAEHIMGSIDIEDAVIIAAALSVEDSVIWSDDKHFEKQNRIRVMKTKEMIGPC